MTHIMRKVIFLLVLIALNSISFICLSQNDTIVSDLMKKIQNIERKTNIVNKISLRKHTNNRVFITKAELDSRRIGFYSRMKYFKGGIKKEHIKYYSLPQEFLILEIIKINDKYDYINYVEYEKDNYYQLYIKSDEVLIDNKYYRIRIYDKERKMVDERKKINSK